VSKAIADLQNPLMRGLACAALHPGLRSILVFDASVATLQVMAGLLAQMIAADTGGEIVSLPKSKSGTKHKIVTVQLGTVETEEELWGSLTLGQEVASRSVVWRSGLLAAGRDWETRIVMIPDLTRLSLAASRACVMLMGSEVAYLERHGQRDRWQPQLYWLAGCDHKRIGAVSTHLLDRFALRLSGGESQNSEQRVAQLRAWLERLEQEQFHFEKAPPTPDWMGVDAPLLSPEIVSRLQQVKHSYPEVLLEARERVLDYLETTDGYSTRRDLALLRLARVHAQLEGAAQVNREDVERAAEMIGLSPKPKLPEKPLANDVKPDTGADDAQSKRSRQEFDWSNLPGSESAPPSIQHEPVFESDTTKTLLSTPLPMGQKIFNPYPEDTVEPEREAGSLRWPTRRFKSATSGRGAIIGVEPATIPQDLALVNTLLESAKYQKLRWKALLEKQTPPEWVRHLLLKRNENGHEPLILQSSDLRRYRRAIVPEQMLALVLDYTCLPECNWQETLLPYLQWAYVERATICLVQVGGIDAEDELRAQKQEANNILVPRIQSRLEVDRGKATPLAHGLDLALQTLRHALQHGRSAVKQAVLVVISDGRGNVPLEASRAGRVVLPVGKRGIEDALQVARQIATLKGVESVVLNPQPKYYADLPVKLAQALGAKIAEIPSLKAWEVDG
jgi:magnesium chelatase subunit D